MKRTLLILCCLAGFGAHGQKSDQLASTPQMGRNSWNKFQANIDDATIRGMADAMVSSGMRDAAR